MDLSTKLLDMIEAVGQAPSDRTALIAMLQPLIVQFDMDQAAVCEWSDGAPRPIFAIDRTRRVLNIEEDRLLLSRTLIHQAVTSMEPTIHVNRDAEESPSKSINELSIRCIVCIPFSRNPARVVLLASQRNPLRIIDSGDLSQIKTATRAAILAFQQRHSLQNLREQNAHLQGVLEEKSHNFIYACEAMGNVAKEAAKLAPYNINVFLHGESGVGKEEMAREIHRVSGRSGKFVAVNCANLTETLLESELFGHVKGAFTGAFQSKIGLLQEADGGTFFLDEIGDLPLSLQAKLLRVIQERCFRPLGSTKDSEVNIRFLAASHKNLIELVGQKKFRDDLYYRIQESTLVIPPLRERREDIEVLANHFVKTFAKEFQLDHRRLDEGALEKLLSYEWPGNIRELKNVCRMAVILASTSVVGADNIRLQPLKPKEDSRPAPAAIAAVPQNVSEISQGRPASPVNQDSVLFSFAPAQSGSLRDIIQDFERNLVLRLLEEESATQSTVADRLGISVRTLQRVISRSGGEPVRAH